MGSSVPKGRFVLVVEDDAILRMNALDMFEEAGLGVLEAANADAALRLLELHGQEVATLFTDINMPGSMDGLDLAKAVFERWPHDTVNLTLLLALSGVEVRSRPGFSNSSDPPGYC